MRRKGVSHGVRITQAGSVPHICCILLFRSLYGHSMVETDAWHSIWTSPNLPHHYPPSDRLWNCLCCCPQRPSSPHPSIHRRGLVYYTLIQFRWVTERCGRPCSTYHRSSPLYNCWIYWALLGTYNRRIFGRKCELRLALVLLGNSNLECGRFLIMLLLHARNSSPCFAQVQSN